MIEEEFTTILEGTKRYSSLTSTKLVTEMNLNDTNHYDQHCTSISEIIR